MASHRMEPRVQVRPCTWGQRRSECVDSGRPITGITNTAGRPRCALMDGCILHMGLSGAPGHLHRPRWLGSSGFRNACSLGGSRISFWLIGAELHKASLPKLRHHGGWPCVKLEWTRHVQRGSRIFQWIINSRRKRQQTRKKSPITYIFIPLQNATVLTK